MKGLEEEPRRMHSYIIRSGPPSQSLRKVSSYWGPTHPASENRNCPPKHRSYLVRKLHFADLSRRHRKPQFEKPADSASPVSKTPIFDTAPGRDKSGFGIGDRSSITAGRSLFYNTVYPRRTPISAM